MNLALEAYFFCGLLLNCMFVQTAQQSFTLVQPNQIQYKVFGLFDRSHEGVTCVRMQSNSGKPGELTGLSLACDILDAIKKVKEVLLKEQIMRIFATVAETIDKVSPGIYGITDLVPVALLKNVCLSAIPHSFVVVPDINDLSRMCCGDHATLLMTGLGEDDALIHMAAVEKMPIKPQKVFFERPCRIDLMFGDGDKESFCKSVESMRQTIKAIDAAKQTYFYAGLLLDKKRREDGQWRRFPKELRDNILGFVGHPYDALDKK